MIEREDAQELHDMCATNQLDAYYTMLLDCPSEALRSGTWSIIREQSSCMEYETTSRLLGVRNLSYILAPVASVGSQILGRSAVARLTPELTEPVDRLLRHMSPQELFTAANTARLGAIIRNHVSVPLSSGSEPRIRVWFATQPRFQPYFGAWQEWIEHLDASATDHPFALSLLARYGGGVVAIRERGQIAAYTGLRAYSPDICELMRPTVTGHIPADAAARPAELVTALLSSATRLALESGRIPVIVTHPGDRLSKIVERLGYQRYASASIFTGVIR